MDVYYYDLEEKLALGNVIKCDSMEELFGLVDVVIFYVDGCLENNNIFGVK